MSIQNNFPTIKPTLLLDFANTEQLDPRITFTRASTATYYGTQTAKAEENLLIRSQEFDQVAGWAVTNTSIISNSVAAPDSTTTADTFTASSGNTEHYLTSATFNPISGQRFAISVFAKKNTHDFVQFAIGNQAGTFANYNLATGATGTSAGVVSSSIVESPVGSGWYRISMVFDYSATVASSLVISIVDSASALRRAAFNASGTESIYFWGAQVEQRSAVTAYTPTTTVPITNYIPQMLTAASGVPRFDHNPITFESLGLEIEEQRTNLLTYSEQFDNAAWTKANATITANTIAAPDGALTGDKLVEDTSNSIHLCTQSVTLAASTVYARTLYVKAAERSGIELQADPTLYGGTPQRVQFNLTTQVVTVASGTATGSMQSVGNGWFRLTVIYPATSGSGSNGFQTRLLDGSGNNSYTGDGYSGVFIWGAQLEAGTFPTSYIPTVASQVTRAVDSASMTGTNFSSWYNDAEGTLFVEMQKLAVETSGFPRAAVLHDGTISNTIQIVWNNSVSRFYGDVQVSGVSQADLGVNGTTQTNVNKIALGYLTNNFGASVNGASATTDVSGNVPSGITTFRLGAAAGGTGQINSTIKKIAYYPMRVTNAQLQGLTS